MNEPADPPDPERPSFDDDPQVRGSLLGFVAHEMRNPLSTALWSAELLVRLAPEERAGARGEKLSGMCLRSLQRLRVLMEDHFLADRLAVSGMPLRIESVALRAVLDGVRAKAGVPEATLDVPEELWASADRLLAERALEGLLAISGRGGVPVRVTGSATPDGRSAIVRLRGAPVAADALNTPQKGTPSDPTGRALALHMARRVAVALGGELSASDETLELRLPIATTPPPVRSEE